MIKISGGRMSKALIDKSLETIIRQYTLLEDDKNIFSQYLRLMSAYDLLPNDALIIAPIYFTE